MPSKGVNGLVWDLFSQSGDPQYYLLYRALFNPKSKKEREREELERMTR